jgi:hypothetical protein
LLLLSFIRFFFSFPSVISSTSVSAGTQRLFFLAFVSLSQISMTEIYWLVSLEPLIPLTHSARRRARRSVSLTLVALVPLDHFPAQNCTKVKYWKSQKSQCLQSAVTSEVGKKKITALSFQLRTSNSHDS